MAPDSPGPFLFKMDTIKGYVEHIIYRNEDNGYTVLNLICDEDELTCVGYLKTIDGGECIEAEGTLTSHPVYGEQFKISSFHVTVPEDRLSMERYLGSGAIKGIGESLAARIVKTFGDDTFRIIENEPERLAEVKGISERKAREIALQYYEKRDTREAMIFLQTYGITGPLAVRIYEQYGDGMYRLLKENPYRLAEDIDGIGFKTADDIASKIGISPDSDYRIRSGILYALMQASLDGHCFLPKTELREKTGILLGTDPGDFDTHLTNLAIDKKVIIKNGPEKEVRVYASTYYYAELSCARMMFGIYKTCEEEMLSDTLRGHIEQKISFLEEAEDIILDNLQKEAVIKAITSGVLVITGGPGTGKTTTINMIIRYFLEEGLDIFLAAPTGRAAKRMTEATGYEAKTIHRLLELNGAMDENRRAARFERNEDNPLEADVIIIDEMSMVDIFLFQSLLKAVAMGTRLILVGDEGQLPSVGPGQVLADVIGSGVFPVVRLQKIFRQAEGSDIVTNAHRVHEGMYPVLDNLSKDFFFLEREEIGVIYKHMVLLITEKLPGYVGVSPQDIQVLTPMRKGQLGAITLNEILQKYINPPSSEKAEYAYGDVVFRENDKVMQIKNDYQLEWEIVSKYNIPIDRGMGIFNGDIGKIVQINEYARELIVEYDEQRRVRYGFDRLDEIEHAYALTIHKSQGSEYPAVIMPILSGPQMLFNRNLLYTGITRARDCVTILGNASTLKDMVDNNNISRRYTSLAEYIREWKEEEQN